MLNVAADFGSDGRVLLADDKRIEEDRGRRNRIDCRIHALGGHLTRQHDHAVDMRRDRRHGGGGGKPRRDRDRPRSGGPQPPPPARPPPPNRHPAPPIWAVTPPPPPGPAPR